MHPKKVGRSLDRSGLTVLQHNCQNSWNAAEIVFSFCTSISPPPDIIALQEVPCWKGNIPSHQNYLAFSSLATAETPPKVATYVSKTLCGSARVHTTHLASPTPYAISIRLDTAHAIFPEGPVSMVVRNVYIPPRRDTLRRAAVTAFPPGLDATPFLLLGDFNLHHPAADPLRDFSVQELALSQPFFETAAEKGVTLLNHEGIHTRFPQGGNARPSTLDLSLASPLLKKHLSEWDAGSLPPTGSDHVPIVIKFSAPTWGDASQIPRWKELTEDDVKGALTGFSLRPIPGNPTPAMMDSWFHTHLGKLRAALQARVPWSRPSPRSKPWWSPMLSSLRKIFASADRALRKDPK